LEDANDSVIFTTSVVPRWLYSTKTSADKIIVWKNLRPYFGVVLPYHPVTD
jgi:hypothetical protein